MKIGVRCVSHLARSLQLQSTVRGVVEGLGFGVWGLGFGVWCLEFEDWGLGFGVRGLGLELKHLNLPRMMGVDYV